MILHLRSVMLVFVQWCLSMFNDACHRSVILHLHSVMLVFIQWCLSSFNATSPTFSDACLRSMSLYLRSIMLHLRSVVFVNMQWYFTCVQWCLSTFHYTSHAFSDVCLHSIILHLRSTKEIFLQRLIICSVEELQQQHQLVELVSCRIVGGAAVIWLPVLLLCHWVSL